MSLRTRDVCRARRNRGATWPLTVLLSLLTLFSCLDASAQASAGAAASGQVVAAATGKASDWIPFFQALLWPLLLAGVAVWLRADIPRVFRAVANRIEQGDSIEAGVSGIKLTSLRAAATVAPGAPLDSDEAIFTVPHPIYLIHSSRRDARLDKDDLEYYRIRVWLDGDTPELLDRVQSVTYHLHPSFEHPVRVVSDREGGFPLATAAWGQFVISATVKLLDQAAPLELERYLDF